MTVASRKIRRRIGAISGQDARVRTPWLAAMLCCLAIVAAGLYGAWYWQEYNRPGRTAYEQGLDEVTARQYAQAKASWILGTQEDPGYAQNWDELGDLYFQGEQYPVAAAYYSGAAKANPNDGSVFEKIAHADLLADDMGGALDAAKRAAVLRPNDADALVFYGALASHLYFFSAAQVALRHAINLQPQNPVARLDLVYCDGNDLNFAAAERDLRPYLQIHPSDPEACYLMALICLQKPPTPANLQIGIAAAQRALAQWPNDPRFFLALGQLELAEERPRQAQQSYLTGLQFAPYSPAIWHGLLTCDMRLGQSRAAFAASASMQDAIKQLAGQPDPALGSGNRY